MKRALVTLLLAVGLSVSLFADEAKPEKKKTGRIGELTAEEEDKLDQVIDRFIEYDIGKLRGAEGKKALEDFSKLGPESIPSLIRGLNKAASLSHSCPAVSIGKKLSRLLASSEDDKVLDFARENIGAGVSRSPYSSLFDNLKLTCMLRKRALRDMQSLKRNPPVVSPGQGLVPGQSSSPGQNASPGQRPGSSPGNSSPGQSPGNRSPGEVPR